MTEHPPNRAPGQQAPRTPARAPRGRAPAGAALDDLVTAVLTASRVLMAVSAASLADTEATLTPPQFRTLVVLDTRGESSIRELAAGLGVTNATAAGLVDRLATAGLVTCVPAARRPRDSVVALSRAGAELVWRVTDRRRGQIARIVRAMPPDRRADLVAALNAFADAAHEPYATRNPTVFGW